MAKLHGCYREESGVCMMEISWWLAGNRESILLGLFVSDSVACYWKLVLSRNTGIHLRGQMGNKVIDQEHDNYMAARKPHREYPFLLQGKHQTAAKALPG